MIFLYKSFFVNYILSFSLVGLWTIRVKSSVAYSLGAVLRSCAKDMTITIVMINPQKENGAGVWMTSCPKEMVLRIWGFWKSVIWDWKIEARVETSVVEACRRVLQISTGRDLKRHKMHRALGRDQHSKNFVSRFVSPWTEIKKLINRSHLKQQSSPVFISLSVLLSLTSPNSIQHRYDCIYNVKQIYQSQRNLIKRIDCFFKYFLIYFGQSLVQNVYDSNICCWSWLSFLQAIFIKYWEQN